MALNKYWLTILGSLILVVSWYFEKVEISKESDIISSAKAQDLDYRLGLADRATAYLTSEMLAFNNRHDSNITSKETVIGSYTNELRAEETLAFGGKLMNIDYDDGKKAESLYEEFRANQNLYTNLINTHNYDKIYTMLLKSRANSFDHYISDQVQVGLKVQAAREAIDKTQFLTLLLYAFGIILITIDKVKEAVFNVNDTKELKALLSQVKAQNTILLHRKDNGDKKK